MELEGHAAIDGEGFAGDESGRVEDGVVDDLGGATGTAGLLVGPADVEPASEDADGDAKRHA